MQSGARVALFLVFKNEKVKTLEVVNLIDTLWMPYILFVGIFTSLPLYVFLNKNRLVIHNPFY